MELLRRWIWTLLSSLTGLGLSQIQAPHGFSFNPSSQVSNRLITPNNDGRNDVVVFTFSNPRFSAVSGRIFDLQSKFVADLRPGPAADSLLWDGKSAGRAVPSGVYFYVIEAESQAFTGTVAVVR